MSESIEMTFEKYGPKKFRKKPVIIEAILAQSEWRIPTLDGVMWAKEGDWIIKGVNGEFYPCKPDIFEKTYEALEGEE